MAAKRSIVSLVFSSVLISSICFALVEISRADDKPGQKPSAVTLTKMTYGFKTTTNDKDWNTQVGAEVLINGRDVAQRYDFDHDKKVDHWNDNSSHGPWDLPISAHPTKDEMYHGIYRVSATAHGNDRWEFEAFLHAEYSDGTEDNWHFINGSLNSQASHGATQEFSLSEHHH